MLSVAVPGATEKAAAQAGTTVATGDGGFTVTESVASPEPDDQQPLNVLFPEVGSDGLPYHPAGATVVSCTSSHPDGIYVLQEKDGLPNPCGTSSDNGNGNNVADRDIVSGYMLIPPGTTSVTFRASNFDPGTETWRAGAVHLYAAPTDDFSQLAYLGGGGVSLGSPNDGSGNPTRPDEVNEIEFTLNFPGGSSGCVANPAAAYQLYVFDGHARMSASITWKVTGSAEDTGGEFTTIPTAYLSSVAGYDDDPNGNGTPDWQEADTDGDGIPDYIEGELSGYADTDGDGQADCNDAPETTPDESLGNTIGEPVTIDVMANDPDGNPLLDPTTVAIDDPNYDPSTGTLVVPGEGTWTVDPDTGAITFTPEDGFEGDPTPIAYTVQDVSGATSPPTSVTVDYAPEATNDESLGNPVGSTVTIDVLANDSGDIDPTTVMILDPDGNPVTELVVPGEGTWTVDPDTGAITFTPEDGFEGDSAPIQYQVADDLGQLTPPVDVVVDYLPVAEADKSLDNPAGSTVTIDVLGNDSTQLDPTTVAIDDPNYDPSTGTLVVPGEGTWTVDPVTGAISFEPEPGFLGDPTPITYTAADVDGNEVSAEVVVTYVDPEVVENDESLGNTPGTAVTLDVVGNDGDVDPTSVMLVDPVTGVLAAELVVAGEGTWTVDPVTGALTFTPDAGFEGDPTPVDYQVTSVLGEVLTATATITYVDPTPAALALTGVESSELALLAALLLALGYGMTLLAVRRNEEDGIA